MSMVTLNITNPKARAMIIWDETINAMNTSTYQIFIENFQSTFDDLLPVELTSFTAAVNQDKVDLGWETKTGVNNHGFNIERRMNEDEWKIIGFVEGNGSSISPKNYSYCDKDIYTGGSKFQYRLKQMDFDGSFEYSDVVNVAVVPIHYELSQNYPNPLIQVQR